VKQKSEQKNKYKNKKKIQEKDPIQKTKTPFISSPLCKNKGKRRSSTRKRKKKQEKEKEKKKEKKKQNQKYVLGTPLLLIEAHARWLAGDLHDQGTIGKLRRYHAHEHLESHGLSFRRDL